MKHLLLRSEGEHYRFLVAVPLSVELLESLKTRGALTQRLAQEDAELAFTQFTFYGFSVYDQDTSSFDMDEIFGEETPHFSVAELPSGLGEAERMDYGVMTFCPKRSFGLRFGVKHDPQIYETLLASLGDGEIFSD